MAERRDRAAPDEAATEAPPTDAVEAKTEAEPQLTDDVEIDDAGGHPATATEDDPGANAKAAKRQMREREPKPGSRMTEQEQRWGKWLGLISAAGFGVGAQPWLGGEHLAQAGLGVALGMLLWSVARQGYRIRTAVASYMFLFAFGDLFIFGALHIGFAFLLAFRSSREMGQARAEERARQRKAAPAERPASAGGWRRRKSKDADAEGPAPPPLRVKEPNRRYTPPKPKKKRRR